MSAAKDYLAAVVAATRTVVEARVRWEPRGQLERRAAGRAPRPDGFRAALSRADRVNVIAECKRRSPARGLLRREYDPAGIAKAYQDAGAAAVSVLTEPTFFDGAGEHLESVRRSIELPILRKDFILDEYQVIEARAWGADAVLLIAMALEGATLSRLRAFTEEMGLAAVVEVHDRVDLDRALNAGAELVGINSRDLRTLGMDGGTLWTMIARVPVDVVAIAESGLESSDQIRRLREAGYRAFLVGERLMTSPDPRRVLRELVGAAETSRS